MKSLEPYNKKVKRILLPENFSSLLPFPAWNRHLVLCKAVLPVSNGEHGKHSSITTAPYVHCISTYRPSIWYCSRIASHRKLYNFWNTAKVRQLCFALDPVQLPVPNSAHFLILAYGHNVPTVVEQPLDQQPIHAGRNTITYEARLLKALFLRLVE